MHAYESRYCYRGLHAAANVLLGAHKVQDLTKLTDPAGTVWYLGALSHLQSSLIMPKRLLQFCMYNLRIKFTRLQTILCCAHNPHPPQTRCGLKTKAS